ncbi:putative sugar lactone lactonase YvrE [Bradysia coprophila]|uniref:putative sugar lactone lactonase YvrE n=1 Tax=Bradysia coprophila TaxID=38358 RepID=UPI00187D7C84|nr:putative sugar lactone lactonase YvrE [Bradysia coprophila]
MIILAILTIFFIFAQANSNPSVYINEIPVIPPFKVGFGGVWDPRVSSTYFVDHYSNNCYRYSWIEDRMYKATVETNFTISFLFPSREAVNQFLVGAGNTIILVEWDGASETAKLVKVVCEVEANTGNIMNHAVASQFGELIFGTFAPKLCGANVTQGVYQLERNKNQSVVKTLFTDVKVTSGVAIDEKLSVLYHLDGCLQELTAYDRNVITGDLSNKRVVIKFNFPSYTLMVGLIIDSDGHLYTGLYGGSALVWINTKSRTYRLIETPTPFVGDPGFSGRDNNKLTVATGTATPYFSTGQLNMTIDTPLAGSVLRINGLGTRSSGTRLPAT